MPHQTSVRIDDDLWPLYDKARREGKINLTRAVNNMLRERLKSPMPRFRGTDIE